MRTQTILFFVLLVIMVSGMLYGVVPVLGATPTPMMLFQMTPAATVTPDSLLYIMQGATPVSHQASVEAVVHAGVKPMTVTSTTITIGGNLVVTGTFTGNLPDHGHVGATGDGGQLEADEVLLATDIITDYVLSAVGDGSVVWAENTAGISEVTAGDVNSEAATDGYVLTSDGADGAAWEAAAGANIGCRVYNDAAISVPNTTWTTLNFNSERWDTDNLHSTVSATDRITVTTSGVYVVMANVSFDSHANGDRWITVILDGTTEIAVVAQPGNTTTMVASTIYSLTAGQYLQLRVYQSSGGALNVTAIANYSPELMVQKIG